MSGTNREAAVDYNALLLFAAVAEERSLTRAATLLHLPKSTVSRKLAALERDLGTALFSRDGRELELTGAGRSLIDSAAPPLGQLRGAIADFLRMASAPTGEVRLSVPDDFGRARASALLVGFLQTHPSFALQVIFSDRQLELAAEGIDAAVRVGELRDTSVVARRIGAIHGLLVASPAYLKAHGGGPRSPQELLAHDCLVFDSPPSSRAWRLVGPGKTIFQIEVRPLLSANALTTICDAAVAGLGIARVPRYAVKEALERRRLVEVLPGWASAPRAVYLVHPAGKIPERARALIGYLRKNAGPILCD